MFLKLTTFYFEGGLPRANVMANESLRVTCSIFFTFRIILLFAFTCQINQIQVWIQSYMWQIFYHEPNYIRKVNGTRKQFLKILSKRFFVHSI